MKYSKFICVATIAGAVALMGSAATAQEQSFVGTWRGQMTMVGAGGDNMVIDSQDTFQADGTFTAQTTSHYGSGPTAGALIGSITGAGTYRVDPAQATISFHINNFTSSDKSINPPTDETDHYTFTSPTTLTVQAQAGAQTATFQKVQ